MTDTYAINLRILRHGAVLVNEAYAHRSAPGIVCINVDLHSKYAEKLMVMHQAGRAPRLYLGAGPATLKVNDSVPRDTGTIIEFTDYVGWQVFSCSDPARYTVALTLVAPEESVASMPALASIYE